MSEELNALLSKIENDLHKKGILQKKMLYNIPVATSSSTQKEIEQKMLNETSSYLPFSTKSKIDQSTININTAVTNGNVLSTSNEYETRKLIERELEPYVNSIKKELKVQLDSFQKDADVIKSTKSELSSLKEIVISNKKDIIKLQSARDTYDIKSDVIKLSEEMKQKNEEIFDLRKGIQDLLMKNEEIKATIEVRKETKDNNDEVDEKIKQSEAKMINAIKEIEKNCNKNLLQMGNFFKQSVDETKNVLLSMKNEIENIKEKSKQSNIEIEKRIENIQNNIKSVKESNETAIKDINKKINELSEEIKSKSSDKEINDIKEEIAKINQEIKEIKESKRNSIDMISSLPIANNDDINTINTKLDNLSIRIDQFDSKVSNQTLISSKLNDINQSYNSLKSQIDTNTTTITELNSQLLTAKDNYNLFKSKLDALTLNVSTLENQINVHQNEETSSKEIDEIKIKIKEIVDTIEEVNKKYNEEMSKVNSVFIEFKEKQLQANAINEKTIVCLGEQMVTSLKALKQLEGDKKETEDNFEQIQNGFDQVHSVIIKIPKMEKDYKLMNEFLVELTKKYQELQIKVDNGFENVTQWQSGLVDNISKKMNEIIEDYEKKINQTSQRLQSNRTAASVSDSKGLATKDELTTIIKKIDDLERKVESSRNIQNSKPTNDKFEFKDNKDVFGPDQDWDFDMK